MRAANIVAISSACIWLLYLSFKIKYYISCIRTVPVTVATVGICNVLAKWHSQFIQSHTHKH